MKDQLLKIFLNDGASDLLSHLQLLNLPNTSPHFLKLLFVVIIVGCFSYRLLIDWKNKFESSFEIGKNPTSSIINTL